MKLRDELCLKPATELADLVASRDISAAELCEAHLDRIEAYNPHLNAVVTLVPDLARELAAEVDRKLARGDAAGPLAGLPVAHKDLVPTAGIRTTMGSPIFADHVPSSSLRADRS